MAVLEERTISRNSVGYRNLLLKECKTSMAWCQQTLKTKKEEHYSWLEMLHYFANPMLCLAIASIQDACTCTTKPFVQSLQDACRHATRFLYTHYKRLVVGVQVGFHSQIMRYREISKLLLLLKLVSFYKNNCIKQASLYTPSFCCSHCLSRAVFSNPNFSKRSKQFSLSHSVTRKSW